MDTVEHRISGKQCQENLPEDKTESQTEQERKVKKHEQQEAPKLSNRLLGGKEQRERYNQRTVKQSFSEVKR